ncbi:hypothetical protein OIU77_014004 [Salix suchowensis]|uniref:Malectin-like domain-containing protein n=1 Tax=Salix suchowensis TaxID=1278906 RepID=A0ABQ8ZW03_9ROSI|nr:hypothetical protein OIU77_014004 [Salix suchowensis]
MLSENSVSKPDGRILNVTFTPSSRVSGAYAFFNKIEIVSMPSKLYIQEDASLSLEGQPSSYSMRNSTALEMMHRVNIGGDVISGPEDTGMFRRWNRDDDYFMSDDGNTSIVESQVEVKSSLLEPAYAAPLQVYTSAGDNSTNKKKANTELDGSSRLIMVSITLLGSISVRFLE